ncbi:hypothetical protein SCP_0201410 [Sparassis crispa]|uniref:Uncharacterized protein n=1 Tax=Sparassis crispa TaxID=139825 RepID=A0A401G9U2_9APHY|nr:hypothetical protein SCP_0201410 [Sparassis crispa]GBE78944.1 hypothetical protein SCP_0201410 [Sparassis crispa]
MVVDRSATTGSGSKDALPPDTTIVTSVQGVARTHMALSNVLEQRKHRALTPYNANAWESQLCTAGLLGRYKNLPDGLRVGFRINIPQITRTQDPPNKESIVTFAPEFLKIVNAEIAKGRYIGPFSRTDLEHLIGPFQSSPLSIIPKPGRPGRFRIVQNYSFPHTPSLRFPNPSINSTIDSDLFPSTWGTFNAICLLIRRLPPGSQAAM